MNKFMEEESWTDGGIFADGESVRALWHCGSAEQRALIDLNTWEVQIYIQYDQVKSYPVRSATVYTLMFH